MCLHDWTIYQGLLDKYVYCRLCDLVPDSSSIISRAMLDGPVPYSLPIVLDTPIPLSVVLTSNRLINTNLLWKEADSRDMLYSKNEWVKLGAGHVHTIPFSKYKF